MWGSAHTVNEKNTWPLIYDAVFCVTVIQTIYGQYQQNQSVYFKFIQL